MTTSTNGRVATNKFIIYLVLIAFTAGCTTLKPLPASNAQSYASQLEVGNKVKIIRNNGTDISLKVTALSDEGITGDGVFVAHSDIRQVEVRQFSTGKTVGLIVGIVAVLAAIAGSADTGASFGSGSN